MSRNLGVPYTDEKPYYFISYNSEDEAVVSKYAAALSKFHFHMWYDNGIKIGKNWEVEIVEKMESSEAVIMFLSKNIFLKENSYVYKEFELATKFFNKNIYVIILDEVKESEVPNRFKMWWINVSSLQCIYAFDYDSPEKCIQVLYENVMLQTKSDSINEEQQEKSLPYDENSKIYKGEKTIRFRRLARRLGIFAIILTMLLGACIKYFDLDFNVAESYLGLFLLGFMGAYLFFWSGNESKGINEFYKIICISLLAAIILTFSGNLIYIVLDGFITLPLVLFGMS